MADAPLEEQGHGRVPGLLVQVVAGYQRDSAGAVANA
jgi:hypothetical protein